MATPWTTDRTPRKWGKRYDRMFRRSSIGNRSEYRLFKENDVESDIKKLAKSGHRLSDREIYGEVQDLYDKGKIQRFQKKRILGKLRGMFFGSGEE